MRGLELKVFKNEKPLTPDQISQNERVLQIALQKIIDIPTEVSDWKIENRENDNTLRMVFFGEILASLEVIFELWNDLSPKQKKDVLSRRNVISFEAECMFDRQTIQKNKRRNFKAEIDKAFNGALEQDQIKEKSKLSLVRVKNVKPRS
ncbi:MAG: hypothetical protein WC858_01790 [Parcubacteria group bacterium]|jgi:hypothetical protein